MALTKNKIVSEIGHRTRLRNHDVQRMLEALIEVWTEELTSGGRIELENFLVLEVRRIDRGEQRGMLVTGQSRQVIRRLVVRPSKKLKARINH
ncbi:MAG TPA: HU family DNA-binding protein [Aggregatilinea sp.]|uniref:HU family DNA-binding protein n=1 Tax=Aggregatilinea sp. TaxID=2806333 RepID=UPI002C3E6773|nr:HU family DNA-binding protein [Aggregatilinea sp.]HML20988.1 HU family DNA-binding protein [Aggregatilinea sp.]